MGTKLFICKSMNMKRYNHTENDYREAAKNSHSIAGMCKYLGRSPYGAGYYMMHKKIEEFGIDVSHFTGQGWNLDGKNLNKGVKRPDEDVFCENSTYNTSQLRKRLISAGYKIEMCEKCGRIEWEGQKIPLETHHINGIHNDNRLENLMLLCPNCHALTDNYCSKNKKKKKKVKVMSSVGVEKVCPICGKKFFAKNKNQKYCSQKCYHSTTNKRPERDILEKLVTENTNTKIGKMYGVSESMVRKWRKMYDI